MHCGEGSLALTGVCVPTGVTYHMWCPEVMRGCERVRRVCVRWRIGEMVIIVHMMVG